MRASTSVSIFHGLPRFILFLPQSNNFFIHLKNSKVVTSPGVTEESNLSLLKPICHGK